MAITNPLPTVVLYGRAGQRITVEPEPHRNANVRCGNCGERREASLSMQCREYHLECAVCGHYSAVEIDSTA